MKYRKMNKEEFFEKLSKNLRDARNFRGLTQKELTLKTIVKSKGNKNRTLDLKTVGLLEANSDGVKMLTLFIIAEAMEVSVENLINGDVFR